MRFLALLLLGNPYAVCQAQEELKPKITLRYFDSRGRAEPIRLTLAALGLPFEEVTYGNCNGGGNCPEGVDEDWGTEKKKGVQSGRLPFGQLPSMTYVDMVTGVTYDMVQSQAILRFLGKHHKFYGTCEQEEILIDVATGGVGDMRAKYSQLVYNEQMADKQKRQQLLEEYKGNYLPQWLGYFEDLLLRAGGEYFGGSSFSIADTMVFDMLDHNLRVDPHCLDKLPALDAFHIAIGHKPGLWVYLQEEQIGPRRKWANGEKAFYDTPSRKPAGTGYIGPPKETKPKQDL